MSGGSSRGSSFSGELSQKIRQAQQEAIDAEFQQRLQRTLSDLLRDYNDRDRDEIQQKLDDVKESLGAEIDGDLEVLFGGSASRHTHVNGISDIDALLLVDDTALADYPPALVRHVIAEVLKGEIPGSPWISEGDLAITLHYDDGLEIQLLPALRSGTRFKISDEEGRDWSPIHPRSFAEKLSSANESANGKLVPTIKLAKAVLASLPEDQRPSGYHVEAMALKAFEGYRGPYAYPAMLVHFFERAGRIVLNPMRDVTGQTEALDAKLGQRNSVARQRSSMALIRIARRMKNASAAESTAQWEAFFEGAE